MKKIYADIMPSGITSGSLRFIKNWEGLLGPKLGKLLKVTIRAKQELEWETSLEYENAILITDGFSVGYWGEGPSGLKEVLTSHGLALTLSIEPGSIHLKEGESYTWIIE